MGCAALGGITTFSSLLDGVDRVPQLQHNGFNQSISDHQLQFMRPRQKLSEQEEMALYARKYEKKASYSDLHEEKKLQPEFFVASQNMQRRISQQPMTGHNHKSNRHNVANKLKLLKQRRRHSMPTNSSSRSNLKPINDEMNRIAVNMQNLQIGNSNYNNNKYQQDDEYGSEIYQTEQRIQNIEQQLKDPLLSAPKRYALNKSLKVEKSKIIRNRRKKEQQKRKFEAGL